MSKFFIILASFTLLTTVACAQGQKSYHTLSDTIISTQVDHRSYTFHFSYRGSSRPHYHHYHYHNRQHYHYHNRQHYQRQYKRTYIVYHPLDYGPTYSTTRFREGGWCVTQNVTRINRYEIQIEEWRTRGRHCRH